MNRKGYLLEDNSSNFFIPSLTLLDSFSQPINDPRNYEERGLELGNMGDMKVKLHEDGAFSHDIGQNLLDKHNKVQFFFSFLTIFQVFDIF